MKFSKHISKKDFSGFYIETFEELVRRAANIHGRFPEKVYCSPKFYLKFYHELCAQHRRLADGPQLSFMDCLVPEHIEWGSHPQGGQEIRIAIYPEINLGEKTEVIVTVY